MGENRLTCVPVVVLRGATRSRLPGGEDDNPAIFLPPITTCAKSVFSRFPGIFPLKARVQLTDWWV